MSKAVTSSYQLAFSLFLDFFPVSAMSFIPPDRVSSFFFLIYPTSVRRDTHDLTSTNVCIFVEPKHRLAFGYSSNSVGLENRLIHYHCNDRSKDEHRVGILKALLSSLCNRLLVHGILNSLFSQTPRCFFIFVTFSHCFGTSRLSSSSPCLFDSFLVHFGITAKEVSLFIPMMSC